MSVRHLHDATSVGGSWEKKNIKFKLRLLARLYHSCYIPPHVRHSPHALSCSVFPVCLTVYQPQLFFSTNCIFLTFFLKSSFLNIGSSIWRRTILVLIQSGWTFRQSLSYNYILCFGRFGNFNQIGVFKIYALQKTKRKKNSKLYSEFTQTLFKIQGLDFWQNAQTSQFVKIFFQ